MGCDVAIIGGGLGGCAAALSATALGMKVILTEETDWLGGQLTAQAVLLTNTLGLNSSVAPAVTENFATLSAKSTATITLCCLRPVPTHT